MRRSSTFTVVLLIGLAVVAAAIGLRCNPNAALPLESAVSIQACPKCKTGVFPDAGAFRTVCPTCGHVITVRDRWNPTQGTPEEQPNRD